MNAIAYRLWLWFWHLLPANPILVRVVSGASRRVRHLWLRTAYLGALLFVVVASLGASLSGESSSLTDLAMGASQTFKYASLVQLAMMCMLAPIFTAAAITQERDAQTFNILLATPLTNAQIVFGSLMSRLYFVIMLLLAGLPIFLMTMVYGGVTQQQVLESFALSGSTAMLTGALAIFIAMSGVGTRRTIFSFYLAIGLYLLAVYMLGVWDRTAVAEAPPNINGDQMSYLAPVHPFLALQVSLNQLEPPPYGHLVGYGDFTRYALAYPSITYVSWTLAAAFVLTMASVFFVRRGAKVGESTVWTRFRDRFRRARSATSRALRNVWNNPVAWREAKMRGGGGGGLLRWIVILGGAVASIFIFINYLRWDPATPGTGISVGDARQWLAGLIAVQFAVALIIATNTAATAMTKEKEAKTMDILLTTPVTSKYILWGKLRGLVSFAAPLLVGPVIALLAFGLVGVMDDQWPPPVWIETGLEVGMLLILFTAFACVIGLKVSLNSRKNVTAIMYSLGTVVLIAGVATAIGFSLTRTGGSLGAFFSAFTPFTAIVCLVDPAQLFDKASNFAAEVRSVRWAGLLGSVVAIPSYTVVVWTIYTNLVRNFDMIVRKQSGT